ncbi:PTS IIA-like nitrogen-regulatory protein PtsN [invertebrate metagenome]|uniref:PTS IIA-like nitrogen-regulatory protein PtsN n=1 Tax=invertebrate metagenome TaxID=1711999 RepID=A0A484H801_9ZZZZ
MEIIDLIHPKSIIANLRVTSKKQALQAMARRAADLTGQSERQIFEILLERERLGTTGVGDGIAIPHGKLPHLNRLYGIFARLNSAINFESIDERPVDLIFLLLAPEVAGVEHLQALARISRLLRNKGTCDKLRDSDRVEVIYALLTEPRPSQAV